MLGLHVEAHGFCMDILFYDFHTNSIEILWCYLPIQNLDLK